MDSSVYRFGYYSCEVFQFDTSLIPVDDLELPSDDELSQPHFYVELIVNKTEKKIQTNHDDANIEAEDDEREEWEWAWASFDDLTLTGNMDESTLHAALYLLYDRIRYRDDMWRHIKDKIGISARSFVEDPANAGRKIFFMSVYVSVEDYYVERVEEDEMEEEEEDPEEEEGDMDYVASYDHMEMEWVGSKNGPASEASVAALANVYVSKVDTCVICQDHMEIGSVAKSMPCDHFYHTDCIEQWLARSNACPLCRFELLTQ